MVDVEDARILCILACWEILSLNDVFIRIAILWQVGI